MLGGLSFGLGRAPGRGARRQRQQPPPTPLASSPAHMATLAIVLVALFASLAIAASSSGWRFEQQAQQQQQQLGNNLNTRQLLSRLASLNDRIALNDFNENVVADEIDADDEQFLRQLKVAARFLDDKLAKEQRERQPSPAQLELEQANGNLLADAQANGQQLPRYALLNEAPTPPGPDERLRYALAALSAPSSSEPVLAATNHGDDNEVVAVNAADLGPPQQLAGAETDEPHQLATANSKANLLNYLMLLDRAHDIEPRLNGVASSNVNAAGDDEKQEATVAAEAGDKIEKREQQAQAPEKSHEESKRRREAVKMTTLLEDEEAPAAKSAKPATEAPVSTTTVTYGKLVDSAPAPNSKQQQQQPTSMLGRLYANITHYLPFLNQISLLRQGEPEGSLQVRPQPSGEPMGGQDKGVKLNDKDDGLKRLQQAKQSVSTTKTIEQKQEQPEAAGQQKREEQESEQQQQQQLVAAIDKTSSLEEVKDSKKKAEDDPEEARVGTAKVHVSSTSKRLSLALAREDYDELEHELDQMIAAEQQQQPATSSFNMIRQSNLMLPMRQVDSLAAAPAAPAQDSLMGRYIYAPTQHYYLNAVPSVGHAQHQEAGKAAGAVAAAHDELRPAYAFQRDQSSGMFDLTHLISQGGGAGKPNDLYFLVMVGAFCMMAMAVVLAAGLFAYRAQQQRKASQPPDYPTYGVVGPNNMSIGLGAGGPGPNGKLGGASALISGYFTSPMANGTGANAGAGGGAVKNGASARHLCKLYGSSASAAATIDSGLDKSSCNSVSSGNVKKSPTSTLSSGVTVTSNSNAANSSSNSNSNSNNNNNAAPTAHETGARCAGNQDAARMYHYQHQKQQMIISDRSSAGRHTSASDLDSDEDNDDGSYTVYECPGLASAHEMEIKNPLFDDDHSP